tara:strand:- start:305 stop:718 length:414 start_codon:yes stop_codon:yes gene_type:complete
MLNNFLIKNSNIPMHYTSHISNTNIELYRPIMIFKPDKTDLILFSSIILETFSTICMKKTLNNKIWFLPVYGGYMSSFYMFPKTLTKYSLSSAYLLWCGIGIILTTLLDNIIYKEIITIKKISGSLIIIIGMILTKR